jgi:C4-dicarboxylate-specific signal transduction histidine kinase
VQVLYPFWRMDTTFQLAGLLSSVFILIALAVSTLSYYMQLIKERHEAQLEDLLKQRNEQLYGQSRYTELGMISRGIAHEISNPLAIIQARATQLLRTYKDPTKLENIARGLEQILFSSERINRTIQGIREFVHQDERHYDEDVKLKELVDDVLVFCGQRMKNHGVNLLFYELDNHRLRGHKIQLEQVILNLMSNSFDAIEFLPDKWIEISAEEASDSIRIYFKDSGSGIPAEIAAHMMEPFYTTKKVGTGTGMGLNLAQTIIEKHGGTITYLDKEKHTTFLINLPKPQMSWRPTKSEGELPTLH